MANIFTNDNRIIDFWQFENNLNAGKNGNNLTASAGGVAYDSATPMVGDYSLQLDSSLNQWAYRNDGDLSAGFPLKNGDTIKKVSFVVWTTPVYVSGDQFLVCKYAATNGKRSLVLLKSSNNLLIYWGYNSGNAYESWTIINNFTAAHEYHIGVAVDGVAKTASVRIYDKTIDSVATYTHNFINELWVGDSPFVVGARGNLDTGYDYSGTVDEVVVANDLLSVDEFDSIRQGIFGLVFVTGVAGVIQSPAVVAAVGYVQVSGSGEVTAGSSVVTGLAAHGESGTVAITQPTSVVTASGVFGETITGIGEVVQSPGVVAATGAHGVSGAGQAVAIPATVAALGGLGVSGQGIAVSGQSQVAGVGAHGVSGIGAAIGSPASVAADGYAAPSGIGQVVGVPGTIAGDCYFGLIVLGIAHITQSPSRMFARGTFRDPLRSRGKRYFESLPASDLRERAVKWIKEEINKAA